MRSLSLVAPLLLSIASSALSAEFCDAPGVVKDEVLPSDIGFALVASECYESTTGPEAVIHTENFIGDDTFVVGVGVWFAMDAGVPAAPSFLVQFFETGSDDCPAGPPIYELDCDIVEAGAGSGSAFDPIEYYVDLVANGGDPFFKADGVKYAVAVTNMNCPGAGANAQWVAGNGDGEIGCFVGFGITEWESKVKLGFDFDQAMYLCNDIPTVPVHTVGWHAVKFAFDR